MVHFQHLKAADKKSNLATIMKEDNCTNELVRRVTQACRVCFVDEKRYLPQCVLSIKKLATLLGYNKAFDEFKRHLGVNMQVFLNKNDFS